MEASAGLRGDTHDVGVPPFPALQPNVGPGPANNVSRSPLLAWHALVRSRLHRAQRYPADARARGESGVATVAFVIDRAGRVVSAYVVTSSGSASLDRASLTAVRTARLPPAPAGAQGPTFPFTIALVYRST